MQKDDQNFQIVVDNLVGNGIVDLALLTQVQMNQTSEGAVYTFTTRNPITVTLVSYNSQTGMLTVMDVEKYTAPVTKPATRPTAPIASTNP